MAYIGRGTGTIKAANITADTITANGSVNTMQISHSKPMASSNDVSVFIDGVAQTPGTDYSVSGSTVTFNTTPADGCKILAIANGDSNADEVVDSSVIGASFKAGAITAAKIVSLPASKLTGTLPAIDASALTGVVSDDAVRNSNNPAANTNPSDGVGSLWINTTTGELHVLTNATTNANEWTNVGSGSGDIIPYNFQGTVSGYMLGGYNHPAGYNGNINKMSFASSTGHTSPADLSRLAYNGGAGKSPTEGYYLGGHNGTVTTAEFNKFTFGSEGTSSGLGNLAHGKANVGTHSTADYIYTTQSLEGSETSNNIIERIATSSDTPSGDIGDMADPTLGGPHTQSETHGYIIGGYRHQSPTGNRTRIEKYQFAASVTSSTVADAGTSVGYGAACSSTTHGVFQRDTDSIRKHDFASDGDAVTHGSFTNTGYSNRSGQSGTTDAFFSGGAAAPGGFTTGWPHVDKVNYASNSTATDWGDLIDPAAGPKGTQY